jgi:hypothetical protein
MERELAKKLFILEDYNSKENMEEHIKEYIYMLKEKFPDLIITREFYKGSNVLVRATQTHTNNQDKNKDEYEIEEVRIKEKGINGLGENVYREKSNGRSRGFGHDGGNERERGGR